MGQRFSVISKIGAAFGAVVVLGLQIPPKQARSNAASWAQAVTGRLPDWPHQLDGWLTGLGGLFIILPVVVWAVNRSLVRRLPAEGSKLTGPVRRVDGLEEREACVEAELGKLVPKNAEFKREFGGITSGRKSLLSIRDDLRNGRADSVWLTTPGQNEAFALLNGLRQAAVDGSLTFWGRRFDYHRPELIAETKPLTPIRAHHFENNDFWFAAFLDSKTNYDTFVGSAESLPSQKQTYRDIHVIKSEYDRWRLNRSG